ncbi:unnamed protein product [Rotaria sp. Silwood1]|nr:unnamed protein product [Rotaria sp. Silwood1]CAF0748333.1 unnamed protein product [Rotaria sp. Silwood1]CAF3335822.1 unnamed protein product [Rotaria sp. Silwood1]CAF3361442.1 unnamed protein product [Rotaria sp. Silwood1]CAF4751660.1 unnamed protein product [Rotaria sp. Silwood1]
MYFNRLSSPDSHCRPTSQINKQERQSLPRNQVFGDTVVDSFLASSSTIAQSSIDISRPDVPKLLASPTKRYVSSFKTLVSSTNSQQTQRLSNLNDNVMILKLPKEHTNNSSITGSPLSSKHSTLSMVTTATIMSTKSQQNFSPSKLSPILKVEGQKRRTVNHDSSIIVSSTSDVPTGSSPANQMAMSTSGHPQTNSSVFTYRSAAAGGNTIRQRTIAETTPNSLLITTDRFKSNISSSIRPTRQLLPTTTLSSTYMSSQQTQRNNNQNIKSRLQSEKFINSREIYEYPDPFTNCPQDILNKLSQLTKLQLETIEWEKKKRFTKKKPVTNGTVQGKDSP